MVIPGPTSFAGVTLAATFTLHLVRRKRRPPTGLPIESYDHNPMTNIRGSIVLLTARAGAMSTNASTSSSEAESSSRGSAVTVETGGRERAAEITFVGVGYRTICAHRRGTSTVGASDAWTYTDRALGTHGAHGHGAHVAGFTGI